MASEDQTDAVRDSFSLDPDPFSLGLAIVGGIAGVGAWLEARRARRLDEEKFRREFRAAWFSCVRSVNALESTIEEFATHVAEQRIEEVPFLFGRTRIQFVTRRAAESFARLSRQVDTTKANITANFNKLSDYLGPDELEDVNRLMSNLGTELSAIPEYYGGVVITGRNSVRGIRAFLRGIGHRNGFEVQ